MKSFFTTLMLFLIISLSLYAQDSTMTVVGPGVKFHSVRKSTPQNIKILEVDLTSPKIKLETVLAKDKMGTGFEKISSMAKRSSYSGHIVLGAINGDFFGISEPNDPYSFLCNSMIKNGEYIDGHQSERTSFAYTDGKKPIMGFLDFEGSVKAKNDSTFIINNINTERYTNGMILYNKYLADSTRTNSYGTEVRIAPIESFKTNQPMKFVVLEKKVNSGNMPFNNNYVLSGHGTAQTFLNNYVNVNDTITLNLGTTINKVGLFSLIGGGPRLVNNGTRPASFAGAEGFDASFTDAANPRTAVGFNRDSTKVYFVTVDGRQPLISAGMTIGQLADYMIYIGCYNALNLDGGGSTTMIVRGTIENSPSDPGGERSCANSLMAVLYADYSEIMTGIRINPRNIIIDSTQTKKITVNGVDTWGYPIEIPFSNVTWEFSGISGSINAQGIFSPTRSGSGKIIAKYNTYADTISVIVLANKIPVWKYCAAGSNLPSWFSPSASTERGFAYSNGKIYVVSRPKIIVLDANTGLQIDTLKTAGITGTFPMDDIEASEDGTIFVGNLTSNAASTHFKIYSFASDTSTAVNIIDFGGSGRLGDKFTVVGKTSDNSAVIYAAASGTNFAYKWTMSNGSFTQTPQKIIFNGMGDPGTNTVVCPKGTGDANLYVNGNSMLPQEYTQAGTLIGTAPATVIDPRSSAMRYIDAVKKYLVVYQYGSSNENAVVLDVTNGIKNAVKVETTAPLGTNSNTAGTSGDIAFRKYSDGLYIYYVLATNNGIGAYQLADTPTDVESDNNNTLPSGYALSQNYPNPFNPATRINYSLPQSGNVTLNVYNMLGQKVASLVNEYKSAGNYSAVFNSSNLSSGTYIYTIRVNDFTSSKKMMLVK